MLRRPQYPCSSCGKACNCKSKRDVIECSACQLWVHRECVPMDKNLMREWDAPGLDFMCRACSFTSDPDPVIYDFAAACRRVQDAVNSSSLQDVLSAEHLLLRTYEVKLPPIVASSYPGSTDPQAREIIQTFQPVILNSYTPLYVRGDGNCFFRALSRGFFGTEEHHLHIRLLSALEMASQLPFYDEQHEDFSNFLGEVEHLYEPYGLEFEAVSTPGSWSSITHFYAPVQL